MTHPLPIRRERIEWLDYWMPDGTAMLEGEAATAQTLPRVLLVGDSICRSYYKGVDEGLKERATIGRMATSKCLCDPGFDRELDLALADYHFDLIHLNNGLHGWDYTEQEYADSLATLLDRITAAQPAAQVIWVQSTPVRVAGDLTTMHPEREPRVQARNRLAAGLAIARGLPITDLYGVLIEHPEYYSQDGTHLNADGQAALAAAVVHGIEAALQL